MSQEPTPRELGYFAAIAQTGIEMVLPIILGYYADDWLGTTPWITVVAAIFGFTAGLTHLIILLKQKERDEATDKRAGGGGDVGNEP
jgi:F0F1-type ATP synthase assembly protein I